MAHSKDEISVKRSILFGARMRFSPTGANIREEAIQRILEQNLAAAESTKGLTEADLRKVLDLGGNIPILRVSDVRSGIEHLKSLNRINEVMEAGRLSYVLSPSSKNETEIIIKESEDRYESILNNLFKSAPGGIDGYKTTFLKLLCLVFSRLGDLYVKVIAGTHAKDSFAGHQLLSITVEEVLRSESVPDPEAFKYAVSRFFRESLPNFDSVKWNMAQSSEIEWTDASWNPVTGCTKVSLGCKNCYAERMAKRLQAMGQRNYVKGFDVATHERTLELPLQWRSRQDIFVNSMSDLFHKKVPLDFIEKVFETMNRANWHRYQILTKRSTRLLELSRHLSWAEHIWMGVSVETEKCLRRVDNLRKTGAHVKFLSLEPLLRPLPKLDLAGIDWVIVGGESGPGARPMLREWVINIRDQCLKAGVPFFFKQWGGVNKKRAGRLLEGRTWDELPRM